MLPNSTEFVCEELTNALRHGVDDYWLINCSNVKPHAYLLDYIAQLWQNGTADPEGHCIAYAQAYYGKANALPVAKCLAGYADHAVSYGAVKNSEKPCKTMSSIFANAKLLLPL